MIGAVCNREQSYTQTRSRISRTRLVITRQSKTAFIYRLCRRQPVVVVPLEVLMTHILATTTGAKPVRPGQVIHGMFSTRNTFRL